jgi:hypothetical protein
MRTELIISCFKNRFPLKKNFMNGFFKLNFFNINIMKSYNSTESTKKVSFLRLNYRPFATTYSIVE